MRLLSVGLGILLSALWMHAGAAATLRVAPTTLELIAPDSAAVLRLRNDAKRPINVQIRVFRWMQSNGADRFEATDMVVASPPATQLAPGMDYTVRVVRTARRPVTGEESYRVVVDELPDPGRRRAGTVSLVVRHVIPVFFRAADAPGPRVSWNLARSGGRLVLVARNTGSSRLRISDVLLRAGGGVVRRESGLLGYVLGGATMQWPLGAAAGLGGGPVTMTVQTHLGPIEATLPIRGR
ncbi:fimbrial biogenesis chaperone [Nitratireductor pacificus]|uniref:Pili assembly chaperone n=1 Tax=Nitratireductor pacificus pht-3B TaxID=391937 RepID=K2M8L3_9HYPH|nr:molecular chaperone [Nitratireductor pacificus]EKF17325.1 Pili assembly chaperone [Nitratireductor pacificus pht-3B]